MSCPAADVLAAFAAGELAGDDDLARVAEHLRTCAACAEVVAHVAGLVRTAPTGTGPDLSRNLK
jgi:anti-sigma factor RsiW